MWSLPDIFHSYNSVYVYYLKSDRIKLYYWVWVNFAYVSICLVCRVCSYVCSLKKSGFTQQLFTATNFHKKGTPNPNTLHIGLYKYVKKNLVEIGKSGHK